MTDTSRPLIAAIDQGTTGTTVLLVDEHDRVVGRGYREIPQFFPQPGWVEHDAEAIWTSVLQALAEAQSQAIGTIAAIGITNQRETVVFWDRANGCAIGRAIVWQDRRTTERCEALRKAGHEASVQAATGLVIDPYFSASKIAWTLEHDETVRQRADAGELALGTIDSWLIHRLSGGSAHVTDVSNASRTQLLDLHTRTWSPSLCALFGVPTVLLPDVRPSAGIFAKARGIAGMDDGVPISGAAGDQQAALFGQGCTVAGQAKCTFGTGSFLLMNVGDKPVVSNQRLLSSVGWTTDKAEQTTYVLEGGAFVCGSLVQWLRDGLGIITKAAEIEGLAASVTSSDGVTIVPALTGLGAPHWRPEARGLISGITRGTTRAHIARAALEAMALQNVDIVNAMEKDAGRSLSTLRVDGGAAANNLLMQIQADLLGIEVERPSLLETTALGAARLAAIGAGLRPYPGAAESSASAVQMDRFSPTLSPGDRESTVARWRDALNRA